MTKIKLPHLIIGGVAKSGTTSLYNTLIQDSRFFFPEHKEPYFFSFKENDSKFDSFQGSFSRLIYKSICDYSKIFDLAHEKQIIGEASTSYLYTSDISISRIVKTYSQYNKKLPKVYFILRNPIDRAWSHYQFLVQRGIETLDFEKAIDPLTVKMRISERFWDFDYLNYGKYARGVSNFQKSIIDTKFYLMDDLLSSGVDNIASDIAGDFTLDGFKPEKGLKKVATNPSGIPKSKTMVTLLARDNFLKSFMRKTLPYGTRKELRYLRDVVLAFFLERKSIDTELRKELIEYYVEDINALSDLLGRDLSHWLKV